jgi:hypothetical protein
MTTDTDDWKDALCPDCGKPASGLGPVGGWLWRCRPCGDRQWGHPQMRYGEGGAAGVLHDARQMTSYSGRECPTWE